MDQQHNNKSKLAFDSIRFLGFDEADRDRYYPVKKVRTEQAARGCSQSELTSQSGVSLRPIQMYEQHRKDIDKTQLSTAISLARTLVCWAEDLAENW